MNNKTGNKVTLIAKDTFADGYTTTEVILSDKDYEHLKELSEQWDNPWALEDDSLVKRLRAIAEEAGNDTGVNVGEWKLGGWELCF